MKTEEIIECLQLRCEATRFNDYLLVNALSRLRTLQSIGKQRDELLKALEAIIERWDTPLWKDVPHTGNYINAARIVVAKAKGE